MKKENLVERERTTIKRQIPKKDISNKRVNLLRLQIEIIIAKGMREEVRKVLRK